MIQHDVFLSHSGKDQAIARQVKDQLESQGLHTWIFEDNAVAGKYRSGVQEDILQSGAAFVVIISANAFASAEVQHEANRAFDLKLQPIPVFVDVLVVRDVQAIGQLSGISGANGVVLDAGNVDTSIGTRLARIVRDDLRRRRISDQNRLPDGREVFGRFQLVDRLVKQIESGRNRLIMLHGPPGAGKSTVARLLATRLIQGGTHVESCFLTKDDIELKHVLTRIQNYLHLPADAGDNKNLILAALASRFRMHKSPVLLLDNFEQVSEEARGELLQAFTEKDWPTVTLVITTRHRFESAALLSVDFEIEPLSYPGEQDILALSAEELRSNYPSLRLFIDHATAGLDATDTNRLLRDDATLRDCARLCGIFNGFPGAIEVAAKSFRRLQNLSRLIRNGNHLCSLRAGDNETMSAAVLSTFELLEKAEQTCFMKCCGFADSFDDDAADAVVSEPAWGPIDSVLATLHDCGLIRRDAAACRWSVYLPILECGQKLLLNDDGVCCDFENRHTDHFVTKAQASPDKQRGVSWDADRGNLVLAIGRSLKRSKPNDSAILLRAAEPSFRARGPASTLLQLAMEIDLAMDNDPASDELLHAEVNLIAGGAAMALGQYSEATRRAQEAYKRSSRAPHDFKIRAINACLGAMEFAENRAEVSKLFGEIQFLMESNKQIKPQDRCVAFIEAAYVRERNEGRAAADKLLDRAESISRDPSVQAWVRWRVLAARGLLLWRDGMPAEALAKFQESLLFVNQEHLDDKWRGGSHTNIALAAVDLNDFDLATKQCELGRACLQRANEQGWLRVNYAAEAFARLFSALRPGAGSVEEKRNAAQNTLNFLEIHEREIDDPQYQYAANMALILSLKGEALLWLGQPDEAEAVLLTARRWCREAAGILTFERHFRTTVILAEIAEANWNAGPLKDYLSDAREFIRMRGPTSRVFLITRTKDMLDRYEQLCLRRKIEP